MPKEKKEKKKPDRDGWIHESDGICWYPGKGIVFGSATDRDGRKSWRACPLYDSEEKTFFSKSEAMEYIKSLEPKGDQS